MKKLVTAIFASAFALALAVPVATACPGHDGSKVVNKEDKQKDGKVVKEDKAAPKKENTKTEKKPVKVSKK
jgi:hypothetical protein